MTETRYLEVYEQVQSSPLFTGIDAESFVAMMTCWNAHMSTYEPGETIVAMDDPKQQFELIVSGRVHMMQEDFLGRRTLIKDKHPGQLATLGSPESLGGRLHYSIVAVEQTQILSLDYSKMTTPCKHACTFHAQLLGNVVQTLIHGHYQMFEHMVHLSKRTTREKLLAYLSTCAQDADSSCFAIPFSRQELADYLCVDRSAMCTELGRLQDAGLIRVEGRHIQILQHGGAPMK